MKQRLFELTGIFSLIMAISIMTACKNSDTTKSDAENVSQDSMQAVVHPEWSADATIYEVNLRQYTEEGTFNAFAEHLPRLKELGIEILWFMPVHPIGEKNRKGEMGSYYSVKDYLAVAPEYGTMDDFKNLVNKAHEMGMYVLIDWVANHTSWDNEMFTNHPEWFTLDSAGNPGPPQDTDWSDVIDLNYDNEKLRTYMIDALKFWVEEADIDGYRCDVADWVPVDFWNEARKELDKVKPVFMLAEAENPKLHEAAFDMTYGWHLHHIFNQIAKGEKDVTEMTNYFETHAKEFQPNDYRMHFITNHDENSWNGTVKERLGDGADAFAVLMSTVPGMPLIYSGQEAGMEKRLKFFEKDVIDWEAGEDKSDFYATLLNLKKDNKALWNGTFGGTMHLVNNSVPTEVFVFKRKKDDEEIVVMTNLSDKIQKFTVECTDFESEYKELFSDETFSFVKDGEYKLEPWAYKVYVK